MLNPSPTGGLPTAAAAFEYASDNAQRAVLFLDVLLRRATQREALRAEAMPSVLAYETELVLDGRRLEPSANYLLSRIVPPRGGTTDPRKQPFVVIDPRAGQGPGIGGFKADSEIGVALGAGHPVYFVGFLPDPVPGQEILDITKVEAAFLEAVISRHPEAEAKPCVVGNCQAGWAVMLLAALRPELFGALILAGAPLSYWAGVRGKYPMRYAGGLMGGSWVTALMGDLGGGLFDGAWLVQNFESQNPANTLWTKQYDVWSRIDSEPERYLGFERWWGDHITLNASEMQWIVDELFIGNHLTGGEIRTPENQSIDLRDVAAPIVVFCSKGDNITPPQQALDWILDLYADVDELIGYGQTIVYTVHDHVGHLGIFVSGSVARKEHEEFASNIDLIEVLPPGLYEAILTPKGEAVTNPDLVTGDWVMRCEPRTLEDIRAFGGNDLADARRFETVARVSEINLSLYRAFVQPMVRAAVTPPLAAALRRMHPLRLSYEMFGPRNPFMAWVPEAAARVRADRRPTGAGNPCATAQEALSHGVVDALDAWQRGVEAASEKIFLGVYGNRALQAAVGLDPESDRWPRKAPEHLAHRERLEARRASLRAAMTEGGAREATARAAIYIGVARGRIDERGFEAIQRLRAKHPHRALPLSGFKRMMRAQFGMLRLDERAALAAIPGLLPESRAERAEAFEMMREVLAASGALDGAAAERLAEMAKLFGLEEEDGTAARERPALRVVAGGDGARGGGQG
jgi:pimeloyl-ACP methyl ester carboxylesterase